MKRLPVLWPVGLLWMLCAGVAECASDPNFAVTPLPVGASVDGASQAALTVSWWQWAMALPVEPHLDPDGSLCASGQRGAVWFLAGTDGTGNVTRTCRIPLGVHLLVPVASRYATRSFAPKEGEGIPGCDELQEHAAMPADGLLKAVVVLDGIEVDGITAHRVRSQGCFDPYPGYPAAEGKPPPLAAGDGYWLLIPPLRPGTHELSVDAHYRRNGPGGFEIVQRYTYVLESGTRAEYVSR